MATPPKDIYKHSLGLRSHAFLLSDEQITILEEKVKFGYTLVQIADSFGVTKATLVKAIRRDPKAMLVYGEARQTYLKPSMEWYNTLFQKENIEKADPNFLLKVFEFAMKSRAGWGHPDIDSLGEEEETVNRPESNAAANKALATLRENHPEEYQKLIEMYECDK